MQPRRGSRGGLGDWCWWCVVVGFGYWLLLVRRRSPAIRFGVFVVLFVNVRDSYIAKRAPSDRIYIVVYAPRGRRRWRCHPLAPWESALRWAQQTVVVDAEIRCFRYKDFLRCTCCAMVAMHKANIYILVYNNAFGSELWPHTRKLGSMIKETRRLRIINIWSWLVDTCSRTSNGGCFS